MLQRTVVFLCVFTVVVCKREGRLFSFNFEDQDIHVDLDVSIPFLSIPIKSASDSLASSGLPTININPAALALGGAVVLGATVLLPLLLKSFTSHSGYTRYSRVLENTDFSADAVINFANHMLTDRRGLRGCALRVACWTEQEHYDHDPSKIMTFIVNNKLLSSIVNSTAINDAILTGRSGRNCEHFSPCPLQKHHMPVLVKDLAAVSKYFGLHNS